MITTYILLQAAMFLIAVGGFFQVKQFLSGHAFIRTDGDMDRFKRLARAQMYAALVYIVLAIVGVAMSMYLTWVIGVYSLVLVVLVSLPHYALGNQMKKLEEKSRGLECAERFAAEYERIGLVWRKKALPDF
jgi:ABC-type multidrug transport system fused ATPase/permease subunit